ncbi:uncharacterized protein METZ01_LOCUS284908, partial [marine metagenome]
VERHQYETWKITKKAVSSEHGVV